MWRLVPALTREMGAGLSRADPRRGADRRDAEARGDALSRHAGARPGDSRGGDARPRAGRQARRRGRVQALRHLRLSARPDPGRAARARHGRRRRRASTRRWSASAPRRARPGPARARRRPRRCGSPCASGSARPSFSATRPRPPKASRRRSSRDGAEVGSLAPGERGWLILNQTPFYGESGGQVGDAGLMLAPGLRVRVLDTKKKLGDLFVHEVEVEEGTLQVGAALELQVDHASARRHARQPFGDPSAARGAAPGARRPRRAEGLAGVARPPALRHRPSQADQPRTNSPRSRTSPIASCCENAPVVTRLMGLDEARASGARALFGEKYGDEVRVVSMGVIDGGDNGPRPFSVELCGGTHVARTGDIGLVSIVGESAVAAGVRRIEAQTRDAARHRLNDGRARARRSRRRCCARRSPRSAAGSRR